MVVLLRIIFNVEKNIQFSDKRRWRDDKKLRTDTNTCLKRLRNMGMNI